MTRLTDNKGIRFIRVIKWSAVLPTLFIALVYSTIGCTVLEDREPCPCYLDVDYTDILAGRPLDAQPAAFDVTVYNPSVADAAVYSPEDAPQVDEVRIRKSMARVVGVFHNRPVRNFLQDGTKVTWERGNQMDSVFVHSTEVDCTGEDAYCLLEAHKQFSTLTFVDAEGQSELEKYNLVVRGNTCGFDAADFLAPIDGEYLADVQEDGTGAQHVRVPRQKDASLVLEFWTKDAQKRKLFSSPIGSYIFSMGYDKEALDLPDYTIRIDFRNMLMYIRVADWEDEYIYALFK